MGAVRSCKEDVVTALILLECVALVCERTRLCLGLGASHAGFPSEAHKAVQILHD